MPLTKKFMWASFFGKKKHFPNLPSWLSGIKNLQELQDGLYERVMVMVAKERRAKKIYMVLAINIIYTRYNFIS